MIIVRRTGNIPNENFLFRRQLHFRRLSAAVAVVATVPTAAAVIVVQLSNHRSFVSLGFEAKLIEVHEGRVTRRSAEF
jgi:hypothetical protein